MNIKIISKSLVLIGMMSLVNGALAQTSKFPTPTPTPTPPGTISSCLDYTPKDIQASTDKVIFCMDLEGKTSVIDVMKERKRLKNSKASSPLELKWTPVDHLSEKKLNEYGIKKAIGMGGGNYNPYAPNGSSMGMGGGIYNPYAPNGSSMGMGINPNVMSDMNSATSGMKKSCASISPNDIMSTKDRVIFCNGLDGKQSVIDVLKEQSRLFGMSPSMIREVRFTPVDKLSKKKLIEFGLMQKSPESHSLVNKDFDMVRDFCEGLQDQIIDRDENQKEIQARIDSLDKTKDQVDIKFLKAKQDAFAKSNSDSNCKFKAPADVKKSHWNTCSSDCLQTALDGCPAVMAKLGSGMKQNHNSTCPECEKSVTGKAEAVRRAYDMGSPVIETHSNESSPAHIGN